MVAYLLVVVALEMKVDDGAVGFGEVVDEFLQVVVERGVVARDVVVVGDGRGWGSGTLEVDAAASCHTPYPDGLLGGRCDVEELFAEVPEGKHGLLKQVVDFQPVAPIASADGIEQPAVAKHELVECFSVLHNIITYFESEKLQRWKFFWEYFYMKYNFKL
jgi:hypothetical protein